LENSHHRTAAENVVSLPIHLEVTEGDLDEMAYVIIEITKK